MTKPEPPFDTEAFENYKQQLKQYQDKSVPQLVEEITKLGFKLDQALAKIISQLDTVIENEEPEEKENKLDKIISMLKNMQGIQLLTQQGKVK